jgi:type IV pilus assembly protein PilM
MRIPKLTMKKVTAVVGLDIEAGSAAATEVQLNGAARLGATSVVPLEPGLFNDGEVVDPERLGAALSTLFSGDKLPREVRIGVANQRLAMRVLRLPLIEDKGDLEAAVRFQAQDELPMPIDHAVLDYQVLGRFEDGEGGRQMDVAVVAARRDMVAGFLDAARRGGLRPVGIDLSAFALIRALAGAAERPGAAAQSDAAGTDGAAVAPGVLYCNLGDLVNLAVSRGPACTFARVAPFGLGAIAQELSDRSGLTHEHSRQWLAHVGFEQPIEEIEGDAPTVAASREVLEKGASKLIDELRLSLDFYSNQEGALPIEEIVFCGAGSTIPGLVERLGDGIALSFRTARPKGLAHLDDATAGRLTISYGLALEE